MTPRRVLGAGVVAAAVSWLVSHRRSPLVRAWRRVPVSGLAGELAAQHPNLEALGHPGLGHLGVRHRQQAGLAQHG